jgi:serine/threonine-protein kinase
LGEANLATPNDEGKLLELVDKAMELKEAEQLAFINAQTQDNPALRSRAVEMLNTLKHDDEIGLVTGQGLNDLLHEAKPERIGNFKILEEIGRGGMGIVYRAQRLDADFEHHVAIKLVSVNQGSEKLIERLRSERRLLAQLKHPNIAQFYDGGETEQGLPFFVMELVDGKSLQNYLKQDSGNLNERLDIFRQICSAISYAHANTIIHRDLSPSNIIIGEDNIKVIDFGISSNFESEPTNSSFYFTQTAGYTAPERLEGVVVTTLGDVYSLGVILSDLIKDVPAKRQFELAAIIAKATQKAPENRYQSVDAVLTDIQNYQHKQVVSAVNGGLTYRLNCLINANRLAVGAFGSLVLGAFVAAIMFASLYFRAVSAEADAVKRFDDVRSLANFMMFEHYDTVSSLPSSTQARLELAQKALSYLDQLSNIKDAPFSLRIETADGYRRLGDVYGNPIVPNLGRRAQAEQILKEALQTLNGLYQQRDNVPDLMLALADANLSLSEFNFIVLDNTQEAYQHAKQAELFYRKYIQLQIPTDKIIAKVSQALRAQSNALVWEQKGEQALDLAQAALDYMQLEVAKQAQSHILQLELSHTLTTLGYNTTLHLDNLRRTDYGEAAAIMEQGISIARAVLVEQPTDKQSEAMLALNLLHLGTVYYSMDQEALAMTFLNEAKQIVEKLLVIDPNDQELTRRLNSILKQSSMTLAYLSKFEEAYDLSDQYIANQNLLIEAEPDNSGYQRELANGFGMRGEVAKLQGNMQIACTWYEKANQQYEQVILSFKLDPVTTKTERRFINEGLVQC